MKFVRLLRRRPPAWLISNLVLAALLFGFLAADKTSLHWLTPTNAASRPQVDEVTIATTAAMNQLRSDVQRLRARVDTIDGSVHALPNSPRVTPRSSKVSDTRQ